MEPNILFIIIGAIALTSGLLLGKFVFAKNTSKLIQDAEDQPHYRIISETLYPFIIALCMLDISLRIILMIVLHNRILFLFVSS